MALIAGIVSVDENTEEKIFINNGSTVLIKRYTDDEPRKWIFKWIEHTQIAGLLFAATDTFYLVLSGPDAEEKGYERILADEIELCKLVKDAD